MGLKITITGKVHDVGYRLFLLELADSLFIERFDARNVRIDGKQAVVVLVDGDEEQLKEFVELVKSEKPEMAVVEEVKVEEYKGRIRDIERFRASFNTAQLSKIVQVGLKMLEKQDETIKEIRATREELKSEIKSVGEKVDRVSGKIDRVAEKVEEVSGKIDRVVEKVDEVSKKIDKTNELLEKRFEKLEEEIERIKKALIKAGIDI